MPDFEIYEMIILEDVTRTHEEAAKAIAWPYPAQTWHFQQAHFAMKRLVNANIVEKIGDTFRMTVKI